MQNSKGVDYILSSKRPYPEWIRNHTIFKELSRIEKVFPKIGLPNFKEPCDIMNAAEALAEAAKLSNKLATVMNQAVNTLYLSLDKELQSTDKSRNDKCGKIQYAINVMGNLVKSLAYNEHIKQEEGKVVMKLRSDIFVGDKNPIFRKNEALFRVYNKVSDLVADVGGTLQKLDQIPEFKDFSRVNVPNKQYTVAFSSYGEDGAWDIGTVSMRGITSCQAWNAPQSRGLIGSISSKFVGVIYIASDQEIPGYGSKMLNRAMVRFAIHRTTRKPTLIMDTVYPNQNSDTVATFKRVLKDKSGLDVIYIYDKTNTLAEYYIPDESSRQYLKQGEFSYMDYPVQVQTHKPAIKTPEDLSKITDTFKKSVYDDLNKMISTKRELYAAAETRLEALKKEYEEARAKWQEENKDKPEEERTKFDLVMPKMDPELAAFARGGIDNLLAHCDKKHGKGNGAQAFAKLILDSIDVANVNECASPEEYHRKYLMTFLRDSAAIKKLAQAKRLQGTWMKSFPKSSERFFETVFSQIRPYFIASCRELIKKAN